MELQESNYKEMSVELSFIVYYSDEEDEWHSVCLNNNNYEGYSYSKYGAVVNMLEDVGNDLKDPNLTYEDIFISESNNEWFESFAGIDEFEKSNLYVSNIEFKEGINDKKAASNK